MKKSKPYINISETLSLKQEKEILNLTSICNLYDSTSLSFPIEEDTVYFLTYDDNKELIQASCLYFLSNLSYEISSFTLPIMRKQGLFKYAFNEICSYLNKLYPDAYNHINLSFTATSASIADKYILPKLGANKLTEEISMELSLSTSTFDIIKSNPDFHHKIKADTTKANTLDIKIIKAGSEGKYTIFDKKNLVGEFYLLEYDDRVYFYHFRLYKTYKGKGHGYYIFFHILKFLLKNNYKKISLHVKKDNIPAVKIYTFFDFKIVESLASWCLKNI